MLKKIFNYSFVNINVYYLAVLSTFYVCILSCFSFGKTSDILRHRKDAALRGLPVFLREEPKELFKQCLVSALASNKNHHFFWKTYYIMTFYSIVTHVYAIHMHTENNLLCSADVHVCSILSEISAILIGPWFVCTF